MGVGGNAVTWRRRKRGEESEGQEIKEKERWWKGLRKAQES